MILRVIASFGLLLLSIYIGIWLQKDPGYVLIMFQHWTIESTFWIAAIAVIVLVIILYIGFGIIKHIASIPNYWHQWRGDLRLSRAQARTKRGLIEFSEGHWQTAKKHLIAAAPNADQPLVNYLTAAKAAEKLGDHHLRDHYLHLAQTVAPDATIAIELTQAQLQVDNQEWQEAAATLQALQIIAPDHPYVLQLCLQLYQATHNWTDLIAMLPKLKPSKTLSAQDIHDIRKQAYLALLHKNISDSSLEFDINQTIQSLPKDLKHDPDFILCYARHLLAHQQDSSAEKYIREGLKISKNNDLIALYAQLHTDYARIPFIESLISKDPYSAALHLCLGQLFLKQQLWGSAKTHLEKSIQIQPSPQAFYALGTLLEKLEQQAEACQIYRQGLEFLSPAVGLRIQEELE